MTHANLVRTVAATNAERFEQRRQRQIDEVRRQLDTGTWSRRRVAASEVTRVETAVQAWERDRLSRPPLTVEQLKILACPTLSATECWHIALTDDIELRGREVWSRDADEEHTPMTLAGVLAPNVTEDQFWAQVAEGYSK